MSGFRPGDRHVEIDGVRTCLRLSVSALAEIGSALSAKSPAQLAQKLRGGGVREWNLILQIMASPRPKTGLSEERLSEIMPVLSAVISEGLGT